MIAYSCGVFLLRARERTRRVMAFSACGSGSSAVFICGIVEAGENWLIWALGSEEVPGIFIKSECACKKGYFAPWFFFFVLETF